MRTAFKYICTAVKDHTPCWLYRTSRGYINDTHSSQLWFLFFHLESSHHVYVFVRSTSLNVTNQSSISSWRRSRKRFRFRRPTKFGLIVSTTRYNWLEQKAGRHPLRNTEIRFTFQLNWMALNWTITHLNSVTTLFITNPPFFSQNRGDLDSSESYFTSYSQQWKMTKFTTKVHDG